MKKDAWFPPPHEILFRQDNQLPTPIPPGALDNFMEAIQGDGSLWSYFCASLFAREATEFGALWHGCAWTDYQMIGENPSVQQTLPRPVLDDDSNAWRWEFLPNKWLPFCIKNEQEIVVEFYTYKGIMPETIYRHHDTYSVGNYAFRSQFDVVAVGPGGYVH